MHTNLMCFQKAAGAAVCFWSPLLVFLLKDINIPSVKEIGVKFPRGLVKN